MLTRAACFARGIEPVNLDQGSSVPLGFVFELADKLTPSHIGYGFSQFGVFDHVLDSQALHANHLVFVNDACRELMLVVSPPVLDTNMDAGYLQTGFVPVFRALLFLGMPSLSFCQAFLIFGKELGIADSLTSGEHHHGCNAKIESHLLVDHWQVFDAVLYQNGHKVAVCAILGHGDRAGLCVFG